MKTIALYLFLFIHVGIFTMNAQNSAEDLTMNNIRVPHQEQVYLHTNATMMFVGEYMYYTLYCLKENTGQLSNVSKVAYVKLVNQDKEVVLNFKIKLENGIGDSNFFIPSSIPSGNYKLLAYTQWMLNNGRNYFYFKDITILNPYTSDQAVFRSQTTDTAPEIVRQDLNEPTVRPSLSISLNRRQFGTREQVSLNITPYPGQESSGNYSISINKVDELEEKVNKTALDFRKSYPKKQSLKQQILPELRGELLKGKLSVPDSVDLGKGPTIIGASFPGENYLFKTATPDNNGVFYINVDEDYSSDDLFLQVISKNNADYDIVIESEEDIDLNPLQFKSFELDKEMEAIIKERSIYNQIENAYYSSKPDTILIENRNARFYGPATMTYPLDDYTRFSTIKETFVEVAEHVWIQKNSNDEQEFHVRPLAPDLDSGELPLIFIDGILVQDAQRLLDLPAARVESISISRNQHFYGNKTFQGVVDVSTFKSDYYTYYYSPYIKTHKLFKPNGGKQYYQQSYEGDLKEKYQRLPDFRYQLLWLPKFEFKGIEENVSFYSSDISGTFEISLEGFTKNGVPVSLKKQFTVE